MKKTIGRRFILVCIFAVVVSLMIFGSTSERSFAADKVKIGIIGPLQMRPGKAMKQGAMIAAEEINAKGGSLGRQVELFYADEEFTPEKGITALKKLAIQNKVNVVVGGLTSGITLAQMPFLSRYKLIYLGAGSASSSITELVKKDYEKNRLCANGCAGV